MMRTVLRAALCGVLAACLAAATLAFVYASWPALVVEFDRDLPRQVTGVYPSERDNLTGLTFAWTGAEMGVRAPGLDRRVAWTLDVRLRAARPDGRPAAVAFFADGIHLATHVAPQDFGQVQVTIPARGERRRDVAITMRASDTFTPGPGDPRPLGVLLDRLTLTPSGIVLPPRRAFFGAAASAGILGAAVALLGVTAPAAVIAALLIGGGTSALVARGFAPFGTFPLHATWLAIWTAVILVIAARTVEWRTGRALRNTARFALAFSAFAAFVKLLVMLHPDLPIGDALFHAHRFRLVDSGTYVFTSIAPGNYRFPYAPGLYVAALPFADAVTRNTGDMALLRIIVVAFDAVAAALVYFAVVRAWGDRLAAAIAVALYHLVPLDFDIATVGNLTNAFAQSLAVFSLVLVASPALRLERRAAVVALAGLMAAAFLSHTSTFVLLLPASALIAAAFLWKGGPALRSPAYAVAVAASIAALFAVAIYYRHFGEVYAEQWTRISGETAVDAPDAGGRTTIDRLLDAPRQLFLMFGIPMLALAAAGTYRLFVRSARDRLTLSLLGWSVSCMLFFAIGIATPVDMRYYLAAIPAIAITAAAGASWMWTKDGAARAGGAALLLWAAFTGVVGVLRF